MIFEGKNIRVYDGPKGSMFMKRGCRECPDIYNISDPGITKEILTLYADAGSELIQTNTFNSNGLALEGRGLSDKQEEIIRSAIRIAKEVCEEAEKRTGIKRTVVFATGPSGKMIEPYGDVPEQDAYDSYRKQTETAVAEGTEVIHFETFMDLNEMRIALQAADDVRKELVSKGKKSFLLFATMAFESHGRTMFGNSPEDCCEVFKEYNVDAFGANCACTATQMLPVIKAFSACAGEDAQIIAKPNAGKPITEGDRVLYAETPEMYADACKELIRAGAKIVGGCCGTSELHIKKLCELE